MFKYAQAERRIQRPAHKPAPHLTCLQLIYRPRAEISVVIMRVGRQCREGEGNVSERASLARGRAAVIRIEDRAV